MVVFYCPACWKEIPDDSRTCPYCSADLSRPDAQSYSEKLRRALSHPEPQTAARAAWVLGERREEAAVVELIRVLESTADVYLARECATALGKIGGPLAVPALKRASQRGAAPVRQAAQQALEATAQAAGTDTRAQVKP
ncbi:MAG TPA: HEAT repeat domain-containing protein [Candidatus Xenobia bacterium]|nr:HEAT repeat domain-containing protein [Candidatus Xenobia bacterium]